MEILCDLGAARLGGWVTYVGGHQRHRHWTHITTLQDGSWPAKHVGDGPRARTKQPPAQGAARSRAGRRASGRTRHRRPQSRQVPQPPPPRPKACSFELSLGQARPSRPSSREGYYIYALGVGRRAWSRDRSRHSLSAAAAGLGRTVSSAPPFAWLCQFCC